MTIFPSQHARGLTALLRDDVQIMSSPTPR